MSSVRGRTAVLHEVVVQAAQFQFIFTVMFLQDVVSNSFFNCFSDFGVNGTIIFTLQFRFHVLQNISCSGSVFPHVRAVS